MKSVLWLRTLLLVSFFSFNETKDLKSSFEPRLKLVQRNVEEPKTLDPGEQTKVSTALDTADTALTLLNGEITGQAEAVKEALTKSTIATKSTNLLKKQAMLLKVGRAIGGALKAIQAVAAIANFIFAFFMPSELEVITKLINKRFTQVNSKLDRLDEKLNLMEDSIKANTEYNVFLSKWISWEYKNKNGAKKLFEIRKAMSTAQSKIEKVKLAEEYIKYYENNDLGGNLLNLYRMAAHPDSLTNRNLFDLFNAEHDCDVSKLSQLMIIIKHVMTSAAMQTMTYYIFKGDEKRAKVAFSDMQKYFFDVRGAFDKRVFNCRMDSVVNAKKIADKIMKKMTGFKRVDVASSIFNELSVKHPWYTWAVAATEGDSPKIVGLELRGNTYFTIADRVNPDKKVKYHVVFEDTNAHTLCGDITKARTLVVFKRCDSCDIFASNNILSSKRCSRKSLVKLVQFQAELARLIKTLFYPDFMNSVCQCSKEQINEHFGKRKRRNILCNVEKDCIEPLKNKITTTWGFMASAVSTNYDVCRPDTCKGHGICRSIPFTRTHQCICHSFYDGDACEKHIIFDDTIERLMSKLRHTFNVVNGVPTAVDVYFSVLSLSEKMNLILQKIKASFAHTSNIIQHSKILYNVEDIADLYAKLKKSELNFDQFGKRIHAYFQTTTIFELQNRLRKMILGEGTLNTPGNDIYNSYKREYASQNNGGCSTKYNADIKSFRDSLSYLDLVLGEAILLYYKWLLETKGTTEELRAKYKKEAVYYYDVFKNRQDEYNKYWKSHSCGAIMVSGTNVDCKSELTYEGMVLPLTCDQQRQATPSTLTCKRVGGLLKWDSQPTCKFVWRNWNAWGSCNKECDGGQKERTRTCQVPSSEGLQPGENNPDDLLKCERDQGSSSVETAACNTQPCPCTAKYGNWECFGNRKCIKATMVCDGKDDCGNYDDESKSRCRSQRCRDWLVEVCW